MEAFTPVNPFNNINTDKVPLIMKDLIEEGAFPERDAKEILRIFEKHGASGTAIKGFKPLTNYDEREMEQVCRTASEKLIWMLDNGIISAVDAKKLMSLYFGDLEGDSDLAASKSPELPRVPERSSIVIFRDSSRRRIRFTLENYRGGKSDFKEILPITGKARPYKK